MTSDPHPGRERPAHRRRPRPGTPLLRPAPALLAVGLLAAVAGSCDFKGRAFFEPDAGDVSLLPDVDPVVITVVQPLVGLPGPQNLDNVVFQVADGASTNGALQSGVDGASVTLTVNGAGVPLSGSGGAWTGSLGATADGAVGFRVSARDQAGNAGSLDWSTQLKRKDPVIVFVTAPPASQQTAAGTLDLYYDGTITDPFLTSALGALWFPGADDACGTADDLTVIKGTQAGQVTENTWTYGVAGTFTASLQARTPVQAGGQALAWDLCMGVTSGDNAGDGRGGSNPNIARLFHRSRIAWNPPVPTTGTLSGRVLLNGMTPIANAIVETGTRTVITDANGAYQFTNLDPGNHLVTVRGLPANVVCVPSAKTGTVVAGGVTTVDFSCTTQAAYAVSVVLTYLHFVNFSRVCAAIETTPAQPGAAFAGTFSGPGVLGGLSVSGTLDGAGRATASRDINQPGTYGLSVQVGSVSGSGSVNVTAAAGTGSC